MKTKKFWLIRHGQSTSNAGAITTDPGSTPLTERGRAQAQAVANAFTQAPDLVVTSPYIRTQQTAEPTQARFPTAAHQQWHIQEFDSLAHSKYEGTTKKDRRPWWKNYWRTADPNYKDDGTGESFFEVLGRVETMFKQLRETDSEFTALFAHGIFNSVVMWYWLHLESVDLAAHRMKYVPLFRMGFDTQNCSYIIGHIHPNGRITLSPLQTKHLPKQKLEFKPIRAVRASAATDPRHGRRGRARGRLR